MFANILFLIISLLIISFNQESSFAFFSPLLSFVISIGIYCLLIIYIVFQTKVFKSNTKRATLLFLTNVELIAFLLTYQFVLVAGRIFYTIPFFENFEIFNALWLIFLYFFGLFVFYFFLHKDVHQKNSLEKSSIFSFRQIKFLIPFTLPFLFFTFIFDFYYKLVGPQFAYIEEFTLVITLSFLVLFFIFTPFFVQKIWGCKSLPCSPLKEKLIALCKKADFKYAGMHSWPIMHDQLTAAIIGVVAKYRYVMFTDRLIKEMPEENTVAILAHEIGHSKHHHLIFYPFLFIGATIFLSLLFPIISDEISLIFIKYNSLHLLQYLFVPLMFFIYCILFILYFRFVFGFFSRNFERQADLHIFALDVPADDLINAFKFIAKTMGGYDTPNWHHYSVKERVEFLEACKTDNHLIKKHHKYVKKIIFCYYLILIFLCLPLSVI